MYVILLVSKAFQISCFGPQRADLLLELRCAAELGSLFSSDQLRHFCTFLLKERHQLGKPILHSLH